MQNVLKMCDGNLSHISKNVNVVHPYNGILFNLKKKGILTYDTTQMLSEISQAQKDKYYIKVPVVVKFIDRKKNGDCQGIKEEGTGDLMFNRYRISYEEDEKSSRDGWC